MRDKTEPSVSKLLRVLVAGGVALAGVPGTRAEDKGSAPTEEADKAKGKDKEAEKANAEKEKDKDKKSAKKSDQDKEAQSSGGGVKGW